MKVVKKLAPKYWLGYYVVYALTMVILTLRYGHLITEGSEAEQIFVAAAIFGVSTGVALTSAVTAEGVGYLILLIPNRIREIKEEGRAEAFAEGREEGREEGRAEAFAEVRAKSEEAAERRKEGRAEAQAERQAEVLTEGAEVWVKAGVEVGHKTGAAEERERLNRLLARYERGEITYDELRVIFSARLNGDNGAD